MAGKQFQRATWRQRIVARGIDVLFLAGLCALLGGNLLPLTISLSVIYLLIGNGLLAGRSIGKRLTGLKVIDARHGGPITPLQDFIRQRYVLFASPLFLLLTAFDESQNCFDKPETFVISAAPVLPKDTETPLEKPAKLQLEAMRKSLERPGR